MFDIVTSADYHQERDQHTKMDEKREKLKLRKILTHQITNETTHDRDVLKPICLLHLFKMSTDGFFSVTLLVCISHRHMNISSIYLCFH